VSSKDVKVRTWADQKAAHSSVETWVPCDREKCFDYVADFSRHPEWATNRVDIAPLDDGVKGGVGARFRAVGHQAGRDWPSELEVTVYDRPSAFEFTATGGPIGTPEDDPHRHTFTFTPDKGGTRMVLARRDPLPPDWSRAKRSLAPLIVRLTSGSRKRTVANLRQRLIDAIDNAP
jgi:uncharacterized protein YndB with AHSA1/START domain